MRRNVEGKPVPRGIEQVHVVATGEFVTASIEDDDSPDFEADFKCALTNHSQAIPALRQSCRKGLCD